VIINYIGIPKMLDKVLYWLILKLAGTRTILINAKVENDTLQTNQYTKGFIYGCRFTVYHQYIKECKLVKAVVSENSFPKI
jgi:hypothetical protein